MCEPTPIEYMGEYQLDELEERIKKRREELKEEEYERFQETQRLQEKANEESRKTQAVLGKYLRIGFLAEYDMWNYYNPCVCLDRGFPRMRGTLKLKVFNQDEFTHKFITEVLDGICISEKLSLHEGKTGYTYRYDIRAIDHEDFMEKHGERMKNANKV